MTVLSPSQFAGRLDVYHVLDAIIARAIFTDPACYQGPPSQRKLAILQYLDVARGIHLPLTQAEARLAHPREGRLRSLAAYGDLTLLGLKGRDVLAQGDGKGFLSPADIDDPESSNRATMAGHVHVLDWLLSFETSKWVNRATAAKQELFLKNTMADEFSQRFAAHQVYFIFPAPSKHAIFEAVRRGHVAALDWWESKRGTLPLVHVFEHSFVRLDFHWPQHMLSIAVEARRQDVVQWIATRLPFHPPTTDAFSIATKRNDVAMLNQLLDTVVSVTAAPATPEHGTWLDKMVTPSMLLVAAHQGCNDALEWMYSAGIVSYLVQHPVYGPGLVGDMLHASQRGFDQVLSWWLGVSIEYGIRLQWDRRCLSAASRAGHVRVLSWWEAHADILPVTYDHSCIDAVTEGVTEVPVHTVCATLDWWLQAALSGQMRIEYSASAVDSASRFGSVEVLDWWWNAHVSHGIMLRYSERATEGACQNGHVPVLEWWFNLHQRHQQPFKYSLLGFSLASAHGHTDVLQWFKARHFQIKFNPKLPLVQAPEISEERRLAVHHFWQQHPEYLDTSLPKQATFQLPSVGPASS